MLSEEEVSSRHGAVGDADDVEVITPKRQRQRSTIEFPYSDLESCVELTRTLHAKAGSQCTMSQLAAWGNQSVGSGGFRSKLSASRLFGLIDAENGNVSTTQLGRHALDEEHCRAARADAFLRVPLFDEMYKKFNGHTLPPPAAIERQMEALGVASKQKDRARQTFSKSANYAGFIDAGSGRFIRPAVSNTPDGEDVATKIQSRGKEQQGVSEKLENSRQTLHPFIEGLLETLPEPKTEWPISERGDWLRTAASIFRLIYKGEGSIEIRVETRSNDNGSQA